MLKFAVLTSTFTKTENFEGALFSRLGFKLKQFLFPFGKQDSRINLFNQDRTDNKRYDYCNFFTTEAFLNQSICQLISIYAPNYPDDDTGVNLRGLPQYYNGYVGLQTFALNVESYKVRALNLPNRLINSYYQIITNLPTTTYISRNNFTNVSSYCFKQYKTGNFFFSYASDQVATATEDFVLSTIQTEIRNNNGILAPNLGENNTIFYKITYPQTLNMPESNISLSKSDETLVRLNANVKDMTSVLSGKKNIKIGQNAQKVINSIAIQNRIREQIFAPPIPNPPLVGFNVIADQPAEFVNTNFDGSETVTVMEPIGAETKESEKLPDFTDTQPDIPVSDIPYTPATTKEQQEKNKRKAEILISRYENELQKLQLDEGDKDYRDFLRDQGRPLRGRVPKYTVSDRKRLIQDYINELELVSIEGSEIPSFKSIEQKAIEDGYIEPYESGAATASYTLQQNPILAESAAAYVSAPIVKGRPEEPTVQAIKGQPLPAAEPGLKQPIQEDEGPAEATAE